MSYSSQIVGLVGVCCLPFLVGACQPNASETEGPKPTPYFSRCPEPVDKLISFYNIGPTRRPKDAPYREPYYMYGMKNWAEFIAKHIEPEYEWGCRRWLLHNPFGDAPGPMHFDQYLRAKAHGFSHLTDDFEEAWGEFLARHPDAEVNIYLGKLRSSEHFIKHLPDRPDLYIERALESVRPALKLGMGVFCDASSSAKEDGPTYAFMKLLKNLGVRVYVEALPKKGYDHLAQFGATCAERFYSRPKRPEYSIDPKTIEGEVVILVTGNLASNKELDRDPKQLEALMKDILKRGHSAALPIRVFLGIHGDS